MVYSHFKKKALIEVGKREGMTWLEGEERKYCRVLCLENFCAPDKGGMRKSFSITTSLPKVSLCEFEES